jgi:hypothetical protein
MFTLKISNGTDTQENSYNTDLHSVKSIAGKTFHQDEILSVEVLENGITKFSLTKTENGVMRHEN